MGGYHCKTPIHCYFVFNSIFAEILLLNNLLNLKYIYLFAVLIYIVQLTLYFKHTKKYKFILIIFFILDIVLSILFPKVIVPLAYAILLNTFLFILAKLF